MANLSARAVTRSTFGSRNACKHTFLSITSDYKYLYVQLYTLMIANMGYDLLYNDVGTAHCTALMRLCYLYQRTPLPHKPPNRPSTATCPPVGTSKPLRGEVLTSMYLAYCFGRVPCSTRRVRNARLQRKCLYCIVPRGRVVAGQRNQPLGQGEGLISGPRLVVCRAR